MKRRSRRKSSAADLLITPPSFAVTPILSPVESPKIFKCSSNCFTTPRNSSSPMKKDIGSNINNNNKPDAEISAATFPAPATALSSPSKARFRIADLKKLASSHIDIIKPQIDCSYSDILKDMEVSHSRLQKRYKVQNQTCEQAMDEAEKEFKKMIDHMSETHGTMEASYMDLISEAQGQATRLCKTTIPELKQSVEKAIDALRSRYRTA